VAVEATVVGTEPTEPIVVATEGTAPKLGATVAPELSIETWVDPLPGASMDVVVHEPIIEKAVPIRSAPMPEATSSSRGGLQLLDDNLIDPAVVARSMESWLHTEQWIKVCCEYPK
jgi:hypothetical protein